MSKVTCEGVSWKTLKRAAERLRLRSSSVGKAIGRMVLNLCGSWIGALDVVMARVSLATREL